MHTQSEKYKLKMSLDDIDLPKFMRANSKCYVNSLFIKKVDLRSVILKNGMIFQRQLWGMCFDLVYFRISVRRNNRCIRTRLVYRRQKWRWKTKKVILMHTVCWSSQYFIYTLTACGWLHPTGDKFIKINQSLQFIQNRV